jgi:ribose transport system substrate-binding protein
VPSPAVSKCRYVLAAAVAAAALGVSACGDDDGDGGGSTGGGASAGAQSDGGGSAAAAKLARLYKGNTGTPPTTGPKAVTNKKVWVISCGQQVASCASGAEAAMAAAKEMGWQVKLYDGKFNPAKFAEGVSQATADKADGILSDAIDCRAAQAQWRQAKKAGIKLVAFYAFDCDDPNVGGQPVFDARVRMQNTDDFGSVMRNWAKDKASYITAKLGSKARVLTFKQDEFLIVKYIREGIEQAIKETPGAKIVEQVPVTGTDAGPKLQQKTQSAITKHPEANAVEGMYDGLILAGVGAGVKASGRAKDLLVVGGEGFKPNMDIIRGGGSEQDAGNGMPSEWMGWAAVDALNRVFAGKPNVDSGIGNRVFDATHNVPASGAYDPGVDFKAAYRKIWGVGVGGA